MTEPALPRCIIVGGGDFDPALLPPRCPRDLLIAADAGYARLKAAGVTPDLCVGDLDSLGAPPEDCPLIRLPVRKDDTDTVAAARLGLSRGFRQFVLLGVLGGRRFSHSLAALSTLLWLREQGADGLILDAGCKVYLLSDERRDYPETAAGSLSLFAVTEEARLTLRGLAYNMEEGSLRRDFPLGVSNSFAARPASVTVRKGTVLAVEEAEE